MERRGLRIQPILLPMPRPLVILAVPRHPVVRGESLPVHRRRGGTLQVVGQRESSGPPPVVIVRYPPPKQYL